MGAGLESPVIQDASERWAIRGCAGYRTSSILMISELGCKLTRSLTRIVCVPGGLTAGPVCTPFRTACTERVNRRARYSG